MTMVALAATAALTVLPAAVAAQAIDGTEAARPYSLPRSATFALRSPAGETYEVMVAWPETPPSADGWPALYVLDGESSFAIAALTARRLARAGERSGIVDGLVVGIAAGPLARRVHDYTPPSPGYVIPAEQPASGLKTGGAEAFLDLLERQVMPCIRKRWRVDQRREALVGHSFGGLLGLQALITRPAMFDAVAAISPSLWFGNGMVERAIARAPDRPPHTRLLIAEGEAHASAKGRQTGSADAIERITVKWPTMEARFLHLPGQTHGTTFLASIAPVIRFAFGKSEQ